MGTWLADPGRTTYLLDVRTPEEYERETLADAASAPGGQLLQATDAYVGVRGARVVLFDNDGVRAPVIASWLRQMGHDALLTLSTYRHVIDEFEDAPRIGAEEAIRQARSGACVTGASEDAER